MTSRFLLAAGAALLLATSAFAQDAGSHGGGMHGVFSPEERMMLFADAAKATAGMTDDQRHAYREQQRDHFMSMSDADKAKLKADLDARWAALTPAQKADIKAKIDAFRAAHGWSGIGHYIRYGSKLDPRLRELAILQVGYLTRSPYEYSHHVKIGHDFGVTEDDIHGIVAETEGRASSLEPLAKTVLKAAREMTTELAISDATFAALKENLSTELFTDLVLTIAFYCAVVRVLATLQIDVEDEYLPYLKQFPLPSAPGPAGG